MSQANKKELTKVNATGKFAVHDVSSLKGKEVLQ
jgi:hypothetical protein